MENNQPPKKSINPLIFVFIAVVIGIGLIFVSSKNKASISKQAESVESSSISKENKDNQETNEVKTVEIEAGSFYFKPNEIKVKKGEKVKIVFKSVSMMHDFVIDELNVRVPITKSGSTASAEFIADKAGTFEYYCSVGNHRQMGQVGQLIVE